MIKCPGSGQWAKNHLADLLVEKAYCHVCDRYVKMRNGKLSTHGSTR